MRIFAYPYELVEASISTDERRVFAFPGGETGTYEQIRAFLKRQGIQIEDPSVTPVARRGTARIRSQLEGNLPISRKLMKDDQWRK